MKLYTKEFEWWWSDGGDVGDTSALGWSTRGSPVGSGSCWLGRIPIWESELFVPLWSRQAVCSSITSSMGVTASVPVLAVGLVSFGSVVHEEASSADTFKAASTFPSVGANNFSSSGVSSCFLSSGVSSPKLLKS